MLKAIRVSLRMYTGSEFFFALVAQEYEWHSPSYKLIWKAYYVALAEFIRFKRDTEEPYFIHLEAVAIIVLLQLIQEGKKDANLVAAALLHDILEMVPRWSKARLIREFNYDIAELVFSVSKTKVIRTPSAIRKRDQKYHATFLYASDRVVRLKLSDVFHNLITLWFTKKRKRRRKLREYSIAYLPLSKKRGILLPEISKEIKKLNQSLIR